MLALTSITPIPGWHTLAEEQIGLGQARQSPRPLDRCPHQFAQARKSRTLSLITHGKPCHPPAKAKRGRDNPG